MKLLTAPALLAVALFSALLGVPFLPLAQNEAGPFYFEARVASSQSGAAQLYFDSGAGFSEPGSSRTAIARSAKLVRYRLGFPSGTYRAFRFDPLDRSATMTIRDARIVSESGRVLREFKPADFKPANQIATCKTDGGQVEITMPPNVDDPSLMLALDSPLVARRGVFDLLASIPRISLLTFVLLVAGLVGFDRWPRGREAAGEAGRWLGRHPKRAVALASAIAVVVSAYPVVFLGKSFVSPNLGTILLYDAYPALPGYDDHEVTDVQLSDVGAIMWQHVPFAAVQYRALKRGELPLWNRYNSLGTPLLGQGQSMFGDPLHLLVIAANSASWAWDLKYLLAKWLFALGLGLIVLAVLERSRGPAVATAPGAPPVPGAMLALSDLIPAVLVAAVAPFIGFFLYRLNHPAYFSLCYAPWALYCWIRITRTGTVRGVAWWSAGLILANLALMTSGTAKEAYMLLLTMNLAGACVLLAAPLTWRQQLGRLGATAWAGAIFALLTAPIWVTFFHTLKSSYTSYNAASAFQLQPSMLLGLFDEIFYRPLMPNLRLLDPSLNFVLLLGLLYFLATLRVQFSNRLSLGIAIASLVPLVFAFGLVPPQWIVRWPILSNVAHLDNTFSCGLIVLWTVLAGVGFAQAARRLGTRNGRDDLIIVGLLLAALVFSWIAFGQAVHRPVLGPTTFTVNKQGESLPVPAFIWGYLAALLLGAVVLMVTVQRAFARRTLSIAAALVIGGCLVVMLWRLALHGPSVGFRGFIQQPTVRVDLQARSDAVSFVRDAVKKEPARGFGLHGNFFPGWTAMYRLETVHSPDAIMSPRVRELVEASGVERLWDWRLYVAPENVGAARPFLDALNVRWYFDLASDQGLLGRALRLARVGDLDVYESPTAWPRAFFTDRVLRYVAPADLIPRLKESHGQPFAAVQASDDAATTALSAIPASLAGRTATAATAYQLTENTTSFQVHASGPGVVVLTETWWPDDFRVYVNGQRGRVLRVNHAFKGVAIPAAGDYAIRFEYWPHRFFRSLTSCAVGAGLLALSLWIATRRPD